MTESHSTLRITSEEIEGFGGSVKTLSISPSGMLANSPVAEGVFTFTGPLLAAQTATWKLYQVGLRFYLKVAAFQGATKAPVAPTRYILTSSTGVALPAAYRPLTTVVMHEVLINDGTTALMSIITLDPAGEIEMRPFDPTTWALAPLGFLIPIGGGLNPFSVPSFCFSYTR